MSTLGVTLAEDGAATVGLTTELLMLKEIIFLFGDIFGLDMSSDSSSSLLCFKKTRKTGLVRCVRNLLVEWALTVCEVHIDGLTSSITNITKHFYCIDTYSSVSFNKLQLSCTYPTRPALLSNTRPLNECFKDRPWKKNNKRNCKQNKQQTKYQKSKKDVFSVYSGRMMVT